MISSLFSEKSTLNFDPLRT